jgi:glutamate 5-kinase
VDGLYTKHPNSVNARFLSYVPEITDEIMAMGQKGSKFGRGGMISKLIAADMVTKAGGSVIIAHAKHSRLKDIFQGTAQLTFFSPCEANLRNKEIWMIFGANVKGKIVIDAGAVDAITNGASLLMQGIKEFTGSFNKGDVVRIVGECSNEETGEAEDLMIARARISYSSLELQHFQNLAPEKRKEYFKANNIREIISHENMVFLKY